MISDNLRHVTFKQDKNLSEILKHLKEQNSLLFKLCHDLSEELLIVQHRKEEIRARLKGAGNTNNINNGSGDVHHTNV